jgi:proline dehydrogenase
MLAGALRAFFLWLSNRRWLGRMAMGMPLVRRMPYRFVAGTTLDQAVEVVRRLNADGASATLDVLGESVDDRASADRAAAQYVETIERIAAEGLDANVSIKLTQMGLDLGVDECLAVLAPVVAAGARHGIFVRIDMEGSAYTDRTLEVVERLRADGCDVGPVIQAYLHRSPADVERLAEGAVRTRICKGAYAEPPEIALQERDAIGDAFVALSGRLLEADAYPGVATHDPDMIARVSAFARERGIGSERFEFQLLHGVRRDLARQCLADGYRVRIYVPFGTEWYPYFMRRLAERPANVWFVLRSVFGEHG